jgi:hypothetical protein
VTLRTSPAGGAQEHDRHVDHGGYDLELKPRAAYKG